MRIMALDLGTKTIGVAMTDPLQIIPQAHETYWRRNQKEDLGYVVDLIERFQVGTVLIGLPLSDEGEETPMSEKARSFAAQLAKKLRFTTRTALRPEIILWDERYSTQDARELLWEQEISKRDHKKYIDQIAASLILEDYLRR